MGTIVEKERELSEYLEEWVAARFGEWTEIYHGINSNRRTGIYRLKFENNYINCYMISSEISMNILQ